MFSLTIRSSTSKSNFNDDSTLMTSGLSKLKIQEPNDWLLQHENSTFNFVDKGSQTCNVTGYVKASSEGISKCTLYVRV